MLTTSPSALRSLTNIAEKLIIDPTLLCPSGKETPNVDRWFRAIVVALTCADTDTRYVNDRDRQHRAQPTCLI